MDNKYHKRCKLINDLWCQCWSQIIQTSLFSLYKTVHYNFTLWMDDFTNSIKHLHVRLVKRTTVGFGCDSFWHNFLLVYVDTTNPYPTSLSPTILYTTTVLLQLFSWCGLIITWYNGCSHFNHKKLKMDFKRIVVIFNKYTCVQQLHPTIMCYTTYKQ